MGKAVILMDEVVEFPGVGYQAQIKVFKVTKTFKFPLGIKVRCVLIDFARGKPVLLLDNHVPSGYHIHRGLPEI